ncbi:MAG TPA: hypothetical protein DCP02_05755 [Actinobacteria bacterium]|nr:hypothetical protein [Actinomycetota bacterium]
MSSKANSISGSGVPVTIASISYEHVLSSFENTGPSDISSFKVGASSSVAPALLQSAAVARRHTRVAIEMNI